MHNPIRIVLLLLALAATDAALAQQNIVFSVPDWGRLSNRDDGKGLATSFQWGVTGAAATATGSGVPASGKPALQDAVLSFPVGDATVMFSKTAMSGTHLPWVLVEFPLVKGDQKGPAPFAIRLTEVFVTSVTFSKSGDGGSGETQVRLKAMKVELFNTLMDPRTGKVLPGRKVGIDTKTMSVF